MRVAGLYVAGLGTWLPERMTVEQADSAGLCRKRAVWRTRIESVCVAEKESATDMAVRAATAALDQAGRGPGEIDLLLHASIYYQGHDLWTPASGIQRAIGGSRCPAVDIGQMSNGAMAAVDLAASYLMADRTRRHALVTTGDRFCLPGVDRWRSDPGTVLADGGTAAVLSTVDGFLRVRSIVVVSDPDLEAMQRDTSAFSDAALAAGAPIDLDRHRRAFVSATGLESMLERIDAGQREAVRAALDDAGLDFADIDRFVLPNLGRGRLDEHYFHRFPIDPDRTTWSWGRTIGHLGAGDQLAGLHHLVESGGIRPGEYCLLLGVGAGFSWTGAVVEAVRPAPAGRRDDDRPAA